jgi:hypothetical protein
MDCPPVRVALGGLAAALALAACAGSDGPPTAPSSTSRATHISFHEPKTPADAASEFVRATAIDQADVTDQLTCRDRPNFGSWPITFVSPGSDTQLHFEVSRVRRTKQATWHVTVEVQIGQHRDGFHVETTVVKSAGHYRVCSAESR